MELVPQARLIHVDPHGRPRSGTRRHWRLGVHAVGDLVGCRGWIPGDYWLSEPGTTNNRMAIRSAIEGLTALTRPCRVGVVSDSQYLVKGMREWLPGWKARGWTRKGGPIENLELWKELDIAAATHAVRWEWVRGHAGHPRNEYANELATQAAKSQDSSEGLVDSRFEEWLEAERQRAGRYLDFHASTPPRSDSR
ncbi:MAG: ribonuclease HI [Gemmatimonadetes bacterium]|nr:ribonuclease HI [Gemmatimonadota bacterium]